MDIFTSKTNPRLHILTHAFWYHECEESIYDTIFMFVNSPNGDGWKWMQENISELDAIMPREEME